MSRATAECWTAKGEFVGWMIYDGTCDIMCREIWHLAKDAWDHFYDEPVEEKTRIECAEGTCKREPCIVHTDYGRGFYWPGTYCPKCRRFNGPCYPYEDETLSLMQDGHPFPLAPKQELQS